MILKKGHAIIGSSTTDHSSGHISYWDVKGEHIWSVTFLNDAVADLLYDEVTDTNGRPLALIVASFASGSLQAFTAAKGKLLWTAQMPAGVTSGCALLKEPGAATLAAVAPTGTRVTVNAQTGAVDAVAALPDHVCAPNAPFSDLNDDVITFCFAANGNLDKIHIFTPTAATTVALPNVPSTCDPRDTTISADVIGRCGAYYAVDAASGVLTEVTTVAPSVPRASVVAGAGGYVAVVGAEGTEIFAAGGARALCPALTAAAHGAPVGLYPGGAPGTVLVALADRSLHAVAAASGALLWTREEALAAVTAAEFVALPASEGAAAEVADLRGEYAEGDSLPARLAARVRGEARHVAAAARALWDSLRGLAATLAACRTPDDVLGVLKTAFAIDRTRNAFAFDQLIVVTTAPGTLLALHTSNNINNNNENNNDNNDDEVKTIKNNRVAWRTYIEPLERSYTAQLHVVESGADGTTAPVLALVRVYKGSSQPRTEVIRFDAHRGAVLSRREYPFAAVQSGVLPRGAGLVALLERDPDYAQVTSERITVHLDGASADETLDPALLNGTAAHTHFFLVDAARGVVSGFNAEHGADAAGAAAGKFEAVAAWELPVAADERIVATARHHPREVVHSGATILGNLTIRAKYLNPNLVAVAAEGPRGLSVRVLDAATGACVAQVAHPGGAAPVRIALVENSVLYHFWGSGQFRMGVIDLYEAETVWDAAKKAAPSAGPVYKAVHAYQQTYNFPYPVRDMRLLATPHGSASKFVLVAMEDGMVYALDKRFVDSRRPVGATWERDQKLLTSSKDLGIFPYHPRIPLYDRNVVTYSRNVAGLRWVITAPTALESTSLAVAVGEDIFFNRVAPLGNFDILSSDFNCGYLILTVVALVVVTFALKRMTNNKIISNYWK